MACMRAFTFLGKNAIQDENSIEGLGGRGKCVEETTYFSQQSLSKDGYPISEGAYAEAKDVNGLSDLAGFFELWRHGCILPEGDEGLEEIDSEELAQVRKVNCITWDSSDGHLLDSDIFFVKGPEPEVRKRFILTSELAGRSDAHVKELEGRAHRRDSSGANSLFAEGRCELSKEELILPVINRELHLSGLEEHGYSWLIENDGCKVTIQFGDNAAFIHALENSDSGASISTNINSDVQFPMQSRTISRFTEEETNLGAKENSVFKLEKTFQHIDLSLKELGIKCGDLYEDIKTISVAKDSSNISSNGILDYNLAGTAEYCGVSTDERSFTGESFLSRCYGNDNFEGGKPGIFKEENFQIHLLNSHASSTAEAPPEGLYYVLPYLELRELLALEQVSKSLRDAVQSDVLLWKSLHIEDPLNEKVTDDVLLRLSARAQGHLQCLSLLQCEKVTARAVRQVLAFNPLLLKLCLPGCTGVSIDAVVAMVKEHVERKSLNGPCLEQLRISGLYGITREHVEQLHSMLITGNLEPRKSKPQYYHYGRYPVYCEDDRILDVEVCPKCANVRVVYDCTRDRCQQKQALKLQQCRGCTFCIARCEECGTCIDDIDYEETFCLGLLCSACWLSLPNCEECNGPGCGKHVDHFIGSPDVILLCTDCCGSSLGDGAEFYVPS